VGLSGWLILIGFGLCIGPVVRLGQIIPSWDSYFSLYAWQSAAVPGGAQYHPLYGPLLIFELLGNILLLTVNVLLIFLFFKRRFHFPRLYIAFVWSNAAFLMIDSVAAQSIPFLAAEEQRSAFRDAYRAVFHALLWGTYMFTSKRVKATFREFGPAVSPVAIQPQDQVNTVS
jgi:hypothetical protein